MLLTVVLENFDWKAETRDYLNAYHEIKYVRL